MQRGFKKVLVSTARFPDGVFIPAIALYEMDGLFYFEKEQALFACLHESDCTYDKETGYIYQKEKDGDTITNFPMQMEIFGETKTMYHLEGWIFWTKEEQEKWEKVDVWER